MTAGPRYAEAARRWAAPEERVTMLNDWLTNPGVLNAIGIGSLLVLLAAFITYVWGQARPSSSAAKPAVGRFSPFLAGVALIGTGVYMVFSNWVDENPKL